MENLNLDSRKRTVVLPNAYFKSYEQFLNMFSTIEDEEVHAALFLLSV